MNNLLQAIKIAHTEKDKPLKVIKYRNGMRSWNPQTDTGYTQYRNACWVIAKYKFVDKLLRAIHYI